MTPEEQSRCSKLYAQQIAAVEHAIDELKRKKQWASEEEETAIEADLLELEGEHTKLIEAKRAVDAGTSTVAPPGQAQVDEVKRLADEVDTLITQQAAAAALMSAVKDALDAFAQA